MEPDRKPEVIDTDNSLDFGQACEDLSWNHRTSTSHMSETNRIAERAVRRMKKGTSAILLQSGLDGNLWADSLECYTYLRNVTDLLSDGKTSYDRRFGQPFKGSIIPFVSWVDHSRIHQFGKKVLVPIVRGGGIWNCDVLVADLAELETMDISEIYSKRLNEREDISQKKWDFIFPFARIKPFGGDQDLRTSTLVRQQPIRGESHALFHHLTTRFWMPKKQFMIFEPCNPQSSFYSPIEESLPITVKHIHVSRITHTNLDGKQEKRIDDYWNIDGSRDLFDPWTDFTHFTLLEEKDPDWYMWSGERLTRKELTSRPDYYDQNS